MVSYRKTFISPSNSVSISSKYYITILYDNTFVFPTINWKHKMEKNHHHYSYFSIRSMLVFHQPKWVDYLSFFLNRHLFEIQVRLIMRLQPCISIILRREDKWSFKLTRTHRSRFHGLKTQWHQSPFALFTLNLLNTSPKYSFFDSKFSSSSSFYYY